MRQRRREGAHRLIPFSGHALHIGRGGMAMVVRAGSGSVVNDDIDAYSFLSPRALPIGCDGMSMVVHTVFGIVVNDDQQFSVWPTHRKLPLGWHYTGPTGTRSEMHVLVRQQFVETIPATYIARDRRVRAAWRAD